MRDDRPRVAVVDCQLGNLASVTWACEAVGLTARPTHDPDDLVDADAVILPGVGAFGEAMRRLDELGLVAGLRSVADSGRPLVGVCLGLQLLFERSYEFGEHEGLGLLPGSVVSLGGPPGSTDSNGRRLRVPHVGWAPVQPATSDRWEQSPLAHVRFGAWMYFVHSYTVEPADPSHVIATAPFGDRSIVAAAGSGSVFGCQFHPERSGPLGLRIYRTLLDGSSSPTERTL